MDVLDSVDGLVVQQRKEWGEIVTGFETRNRYAVATPEGKALYLAAEEQRSMLLRLFLRALRPFTIHILTQDGRAVLRLDRAFRFYFHTLEVRTPDGKRLGSVERTFALVRRKYTVRDDASRERFRLVGPLLHPWTFLVRLHGREIGKITKRWTGFLKEAFTDADNFTVTFPAELPAADKRLLLGAVFLIDFVHFENRRGGGAR